MQPLVSILISLLIIALFCLIIMWILRMFGVPEQILRVALAIVGLILLLWVLGSYAGFAPFPLRR